MLKEIILSSLGTNLFYNFLKKTNLSDVHSNLIISNLHAFYTFFCALLYLLDSINMEKYLNLLYLSFGYAIYDINFLLTVEKKKKIDLIIVHHLIIIIANLWINYYREEFVLKIMACNYLTEFTTPFLNLSFYLYTTNQTHLSFRGYNIFKSCYIVLLLSYFTLRILMPIYLIKITFMYNILFFFQSLIFSINIYWFYKLVDKTKKFIN